MYEFLSFSRDKFKNTPSTPIREVHTEQISEQKKTVTVTQSQILLGGPEGPKCNDLPRTHGSQDS